MILNKIIARLRINSFLLFLVPSIAIIGSLLIHNLLTDPNLPRIGINYEYLTDEPGKKYNTKCTKDIECLGGKCECNCQYGCKEKKRGRTKGPMCCLDINGDINIDDCPDKRCKYKN